MKIIKIAILFILFISNISLAAVSSGWFDYALGKIGQDGRNALNVVTENGLILSRIRNDYAAFTLGEDRLSDEEQESVPIDVSEFDFVIEFETCNSTNELLSGTINRVRFRHNPSNVDEFVDEFLDVQKFYYDIFKKSGETKEATMDRYVESYLGGLKYISNVTFEIKVSKENHYIELEATSPDVCVSN
tara:strand:+ start:224 stop:790 length:567 start_codon:yes stop_codon:yes gene_type:complete